MRKATLAFALFACTGLACAEAFRIQDFPLYVSLSDPQVSPDGRRVAYVRTSATADHRYQYQILMVGLDGDNRQVLTEPALYAHHPRWLSNQELTFLALTRDHGHQVFTLNTRNGETRQASHHSEPLQGYSWSPDGRYLAYAARPAPKTRAPTAYRVTRHSLSPPKAPQSLYLLDIETDGVRELMNVSPIVDRWSGIDWAPDGLALLYTRKNPGHYDEYSNHVVEFQFASSKERHLATGGYPQYAPDGKQILLLARETPEYAAGPRKAYVLDRQGGRVERVAPELDRETLGRWGPEGRVLLSGPDVDAQRLWLADADGGKPIDLEHVEPTWPLQSSWAGDALVFVGVTTGRAEELYVHRQGSTRRITGENAALAERRWGRVESLQWTSPDDTSVSGIVLYPAAFEPERKYPLVVVPHGGPHTSSTQAGVANNLIDQTMAAQGWIVFAPNYRGSTNQGRDFHLVRVKNPNYDREVIQDVMSGIAALQRSCACLDEKRQAIVGASYGGTVAAWATALHPRKWAALVVGNAGLDDVDMYVQSDRGAGFSVRFGGPPWSETQRELYREASPIYAADRIVTPTLILSTLRDPRVPVVSSFKFWRALEDHGVEVQFIAYDTLGHGPADLVDSMDYWQRAIDWVDLHFSEVE